MFYPGLHPRFWIYALFLMAFLLFFNALDCTIYLASAHDLMDSMTGTMTTSFYERGVFVLFRWQFYLTTRGSEPHWDFQKLQDKYNDLFKTCYIFYWNNYYC